MKVEDLAVRGKIGTDGWATLAEALRSGVLFPRFSCVFTLREALIEARVEDLRTIWVAKVGVGEGRALVRHSGVILCVFETV